MRYTRSSYEVLHQAALHLAGNLFIIQTESSAAGEVRTVTVQVRCPQCKAFCQVQQEFLGRPVRCPQCAQAFVAPAAEAGQAQAAGRRGFWQGLKGMMRSLKSAAGPEPAAAPQTTPDSDLELQLDGPAAAGAPPAPAAVAGLQGIRLEIGSASSTGRVRQRNEDSLLVQQTTWANLDRRNEWALVVVADGMGGYEAGDRASALLVQHLAAAAGPVISRALTQPATAEEMAGLLDTTLKSANTAVYQQSQSDPACKGMGATVAAVAIAGEEVRIGHVGDCRVYHFHGGNLKQVTRDQTLVARMVELGKLTLEEARSHPQRNEVTQAIGKHPEIRPEPYQLRLQAGDWLVVASDGLHTHVDNAALAGALTGASGSAAALAQHLVDLANQGGGTDNCTVVAVHCG
jgi:protein phosphatase